MSHLDAAARGHSLHVQQLLPHILQLVLVLNMHSGLLTPLSQDPGQSLVLLLGLLQLLVQIGRNPAGGFQLACAHPKHVIIAGYGMSSLQGTACQHCRVQACQDCRVWHEEGLLLPIASHLVLSGFSGFLVRCVVMMQGRGVEVRQGRQRQH